MSNICKICNHPDRLLIDREIVKGISHSSIARRFNVSGDSVRYHAMNHLSRQLIKSNEMQQAIVSGGLVSEMEDLLTRSKNILNKAEAKGQLNTALSAISQTRGTLELMAKIAATLHQIRAQELERSQGASDEDYEPLPPDAIDRLNNGELMMFIAISEKLMGNRSKNEDVVITVLKELKGTYDPTLPCPPSAYYTLYTDKNRRKRTRTKLPKNYVDPDLEWSEEKALAEERELARQEEERSHPIREREEFHSEDTPSQAWTWKCDEDPFKDAVVPGSIRTSNLALKSFLED
jgi:hypothetical protein